MPRTARTGGVGSSALTFGGVAVLLAALVALGTSGGADDGTDSSLISCPAAPPDAGSYDRRSAARRAGGEIVFATANVEWLFDGLHDPLAPWRGEREAAAHLSAVAAALHALDADVLALVETEGCFMLRRLAGELDRLRNASAAGAAGAAGAYGSFLVAGRDTHTRQQVGLLTRLAPAQELQRSAARARYPREGSRCGARARPLSRSAGVSKHFWTVLRVPELGGAELLLVGAHLKARPTAPDACSQREAQAEVLAGLVAREGTRKGRHVLLMGDLNDFDGADASDNAPSSSVLRQLTTEAGLVSAMAAGAAAVPKAERWTWRATRRLDAARSEELRNPRHPRGALDHVLLSEGLAKMVDRVWVDRAVPGASDHFPLAVRLSFAS